MCTSEPWVNSYLATKHRRLLVWSKLSPDLQEISKGWHNFVRMMHLSFQHEPAHPPAPSYHAHCDICLLCVSTWSWCAVPDIFCQSFATPPTLQDGAHGSILSQVCVAFMKPRRPGLDASLAARLSFFSFFFLIIINQWHTVDNLPWIWGQTDLCVLIFYNITRDQILADLQSGPNCDLRELGEC